VLENTNMIIGGEHYILPSHLFKKSKGYIDDLIENFKDVYEVNFTFGGYYSLLAIIDEIKPKFKDHSIVLLPSYLCPSILKPFKSRRIPYEFYKIDENLFIDINYLISIIDNNVKSILIIDYFGASQMDRLQPVLEILKSKKIIIIQDIVQCLQIRKDNLFGDYIFNSFRKFFPFEGSILLSKEKMTINFGECRNKYIKYKRVGQFLRYLHVKCNLFSSNHFLSFFRKAEGCYYTNYILKMPKFNVRQLNKYNIEFMAKKQKYYFDHLINTYSNKVPELLHKNNFIPMGFVMKIEGRDSIRKYLFEQNIFPTIHWILPNEIDRNMFNRSIELSSFILTIPLCGLTNEKFDYLCTNIDKYVKNEGLSKSFRK
jgi:hypothetical protein